MDGKMSTLFPKMLPVRKHFATSIEIRPSRHTMQKRRWQDGHGGRYLACETALHGNNDQRFRETTMDNDKQIMIDGNLTTVGLVKHWEWFPEADSPDAPDASETDEKRWSAFNAVVGAWRNLDPEVFESVLADEGFTYGSAWVAETMRGKPAYLNYIRGKFDSIKRTNSRPSVEIVCIREGVTTAKYGFGMLMRQGDVKTILTFDFSGTDISSMYMNDPDFFSLESIAVEERDIQLNKKYALESVQEVSHASL